MMNKRKNPLKILENFKIAERNATNKLYLSRKARMTKVREISLLTLSYKTVEDIYIFKAVIISIHLMKFNIYSLFSKALRS